MRTLWLLLPLAMTAAACRRQTGPGAEEAERWPGKSYRIGETTRLALFPRTDLYPWPIADPRRPNVGGSILMLTSRSIPQAGGVRWATTAGGDWGLFRIHQESRPDRGFQFQFGAGVFAQWDAENSQDGIGLDGVYNSFLTWTAGDKLAFRFGINHMSSHVADEYLLKTGFGRINYTREEFVAGVSYRPADSWRTYCEVGDAFERSAAGQERWRVQAGLEYESGRVFWDGLAGWFFALDLQTHEENDWHGSLAAQLGLVMPMSHLGQDMRMGLEFYHGRSPMGEFFQHEETHFAIGFWLGF